ncbi:MAG TPA: hypoxanthine phosphoribosyltransferase [Chloroflexota bacterium]
MDRIELQEPLITAEQIEKRIRELALEVTKEYERSERPLSIIIVLKGACFFAIDLLKHMTLPCRIDFLQASSYSGMGSTGEVRLHSDITLPVADTDVLLIEDIVDTGLTASWLAGHLASHKPASVRLCTLLDKPSARRIPVKIDFIGFTVPEAFVLGYGLDFEEGYRNLPAIYVARPLDDEEQNRSRDA